MAIGVSALLHCAVISFVKVPPAPLPVQSVSLNIVPETPQNQVTLPPQIVSPPETSTLIQPKETRFRSERDSSTEKETIKRGDGGGAPGPVTPPEPKQSSPSKKAKQPLTLKDAGLIAKYSKPSEQEQRPDDTADREPDIFSRAPGSGAAFYGTRGSPDYLPELPDGDLTLLNTKASQYAVFVRRVATRVFGEMRQSGWDFLRASDIIAISDMATVEITMDLSGNLDSIALTESSGSSRFDGVLREAVRKGAGDKNPPPSAALSDGKIHFVFKSRSWVRPIVTRAGTPSEQRWLLLGTGLK